MEPLLWVYWAVALLAPPMIVLAFYVGSINERRRRMQKLDALWAWIGEGQGHYGSGREWIGEVDGRRVGVDWFEGNTTVRIEAHPRVRMGFGRGDQPADLVDESREGQAAMPIDPGEVAYGTDREQVRALVGKPEVKQALDTLLEPDGSSLRKVEVDPEKGVWWFARNLPRELTREDTERWVRSLLAIARAAEAV